LAEVEEEISLEEFMKLDETAPEKGKVKQEEVLGHITGKALTGSKLAELCGVTYSAMYSRLTRLLKKGLVIRRYDPKSGRSYWTRAETE